MNVIQILTNFHHKSGLSAGEVDRVKCAAQLLHQEPDSVALISGTQIGFSPPDVAHHELVADELDRHGIHDTRILGRLADADSTVKEAAHANAFLSDVSFDALCVVTSLSHSPRAPYIFAHFFQLDCLRFHLVPDSNSKDVVLLTEFKEAEAYHQLRSQPGVFVPPGNEIVPTPFSYEEFAELLAKRTTLWSNAPDHDTDAGTEHLNLFGTYRPVLPFGKGK